MDGERGMKVSHRETDILGWGVPWFKAASFDIVLARKVVKKNQIVLPTFLRSIWRSQKIIVIWSVYA